MARCEDIELLLGPFEDGELEPHEMQEVARHTATCIACDGVLADYRTMAVTLRGSQPIPNLDSFAGGVMARIQQMHLPTPVPEMKRRWSDTIGDWFANTIMMGGLAGAVAIITAVVVTPELSGWLHHQAHAGNPVVAMVTPVSKTAPPSVSKLANNSLSQPADTSDGDSDNQVAVADNNGDAGTEISSLQSDNPSVAVWTAPETKTTVVWVPDQQP
jgi:anti-sigma factor RsiW